MRAKGENIAIDEMAFERIVEQRKIKGKSRFEKAKLVAIELGSVVVKEYGAYHIYEDSNLYVSYDDYAENMSIRWNNEPVLTCQVSEIIGFIPGEWEQCLEKLYEPIYLEREKILKANEERLLSAMLAKWGISRADVKVSRKVIEKKKQKRKFLPTRRSNRR